MSEHKIHHHFSDNLVRIIHTWTFVVVHLFLIVGWIIVNIRAPEVAWDKPPFETLKLVLTIEAFFIGIILLMNHYRRLEIDRKLMINDCIINVQIRDLLKELLPKVERLTYKNDK